MNIPQLSKKQRITGIIAVLFVLIGVIALLFSHFGGPRMDADLKNALDKASVVDVYTQQVETEISFVDRDLEVIGTYYIDAPANRFASLSTTTLTIKGESSAGRTHIFTLQNISIGDDIYTKIETESEVLRSSIPHSPEWRHFTKGSIPETFKGIATAGTILDNLAIFRDYEKNLSFVNKQEQYGDETLTRYTLALSGRVQKDAEDALKTILSRVGKDGTIDVWVDMNNDLRRIRFKSDSYRSTTTLLDVNTPPPITPPPIDD